MNLNSNITEIIDRYLNNEMTGNELSAFEKKLKNDLALKKEIEAQKAVINSFKINARNELKDYLKTIKVGNNKNLIIRYSIAATILLFVTIGIILVETNNFKNNTLISHNDYIKDITDTHTVKLPQIKNNLANENKKDSIINKTVNSTDKVYKISKVPIIEVDKTGFAFANDSLSNEFITVKYIISTKYKNNYSYFNDTLNIYTDIKKQNEINIQFNRSKNTYYLIIDKKKYVLVNSEKIHSL